MECHQGRLLLGILDWYFPRIWGRSYVCNLVFFNRKDAFTNTELLYHFGVGQFLFEANFKEGGHAFFRTDLLKIVDADILALTILQEIRDLVGGFKHHMDAHVAGKRNHAILQVFKQGSHDNNGNAANNGRQIKPEAYGQT